MILKRIEIVNLDDIHCCWKCGFDTMVEFVKLCWDLNGNLNDEQIKHASNGIYLATSKHALHRTNTFINLIMGFYNLGYKGFLTHEDAMDLKSAYKDTVFIDGIPNLLQSALLRIHEDKNLDDGYHRISIFKYLGIVMMPVCIIDHREGNMDKFSEDVKTSLKKFFMSEEWLEYKKGNDYSILCRKGNNV